MGHETALGLLSSRHQEVSHSLLALELQDSSSSLCDETDLGTVVLEDGEVDLVGREMMVVDMKKGGLGRGRGRLRGLAVMLDKIDALDIRTMD